ncbi:MAG TPA: bifunctional shikimate kinase/3-dehydroquinate synthase [Solirubrobacteraceae bacterium]|jgi:shikimate kinase/3-dehydroquinate synthase|nr:bifunctional shikimate kinase/3-dehydroquinate synthase [Solirubrobacteraceae bacterium]
MAFVLIGFMGVGKSTAAGELAEALGASALDSDAVLEERFGHPVAREFERNGEAAFRAAEEELVCGLLAEAAPDDVIALGGGSVLSERTRQALGDHVTVLLDVDPETAWGRVSGPAGSAGERPLARDRDAFLALYEARAPLYERLADATLADLPIGGAARAAGALRALAAAPSGTRMLWASSASGEYPVMVGRGLLRGADALELGRIWPVDRSQSRPFCVSDESVHELYGDWLGELAATVAIAPGERHKTLASAERVWQALVGAGMTRADHIVALGGGVVGDLAGFCAATYQRGVPVVQVPTTLVAQVDSAYGGKTGVDLPEAKNYVGAYHQPAGVLVDPDTLATLPAAELAAGWVEVLKTALIAGGWLWEAIVVGADADERVIFACARTKLAIVAADERDAGRRQLLNLGHTVGHAIETVSGYARYRHGEAVGLGLLAALRLSGQDELRELVRGLLEARGLPVDLDGVSVDAVVEATGRDKKRLGGADVPFVLVRAPGDVQFGCEVAREDLRAAVRELAR